VHRSCARIDEIHEPLLIMHGDADRMIPQSQARQLFAAANEPKQACWATGVGHNDLFDSGGFQDGARLHRAADRPTGGGGSTKSCAVRRRLSCSSSTIHIVSRRGTAVSRRTCQVCS
jgi:fermentation-respiration switch protein FrsA (DUF1100 family)